MYIHLENKNLYRLLLLFIVMNCTYIHIHVHKLSILRSHNIIRIDNIIKCAFDQN